ncbi:Bifunctional purine biosynthetic protein ade1 [Oleoguttula sp. CCFEE 5521]
MASSTAITRIDLGSDGFKKIASGKVREIFEIDSETLLFVATDRISAYDVILENGIPQKGALLTQLSAHWFKLIASWLPDLRTHFLSTTLPPDLPTSLPFQQLQDRSMLVDRLRILPLESIVRGYITGSAWAEYSKSGTVHGIPMPKGLRESEKLARPIWTPSTKAEVGGKDENISPEAARALIGEAVARWVEEASLAIYERAHAYAAERGIIIADTKFEFGGDVKTGEVVLVDEVLTPDSSRFWPAEQYEVGRSQVSYDKQYLRDWLTSSGLKGKEGVSMPEEVVAETGKKYREAYEKLTDSKWSDTAGA